MTLATVAGGMGVMKTALSLGVFLALITGSVGAVKIHECVDEHGIRSFQQQPCPPDTASADTRQIYTGPRETGPDMAAITASAPVVFYSVPTCEACDLTRNYLNERGVPFQEKNVIDDIELQEELMAKTGELSVPVVFVGNKRVSGYNRAQLESELDSAGYPGEVTPEMIEAIAEPEPEPEEVPLPMFDPIDPDALDQPEAEPPLDDALAFPE